MEYSTENNEEIYRHKNSIKNREEEGGQRMAGTEMIFYLGNYDKAFPER